MNRIFISGDTEGIILTERFRKKKWPTGKKLTKDDYLIILGETGLVWQDNDFEKHLRKWMRERPWTTLFINGNHDNIPRLQELPEKEMFGNTVGVVEDSIFHLKNGRIYNIGGKSFFCMGGARSYDESTRTEGKDWWREEIPSWKEMGFGLENLKNHDWTIDYVLAHTVPLSIQKLYLPFNRDFKDPTVNYLEHIAVNCNFKQFFSGHFHVDMVRGKFTIISENITEIKE